MNEIRVRQDEENAEQEAVMGNRGGSGPDTRREARWKTSLSVPSANPLTLAIASLTIIRKPQAWTWAFSSHDSMPKPSPSPAALSFCRDNWPLLLCKAAASSQI